MTAEIVRANEVATELDELLWMVLWKPLGLPRDIRGFFKLEGEETALVAQENAQLVGGLVAVRNEDAGLELRHLAVVSHAQGRGVGRSLVERLCRVAKTTKCRHIHTIARNTSAEFFRKLGFQTAAGCAPEHSVFLKHGITFELMEKIVEPDAYTGLAT